jgi:hypothetical protein
MKKEDSYKFFLHKIAFSTNNLLAAYNQIKSKSRNLISSCHSDIFKSIKIMWFKTTSLKLLNASFIYPKACRVIISKKNIKEKHFIILTSPRIKIIEKSILNVLEPRFEGKFV